MRTERHVVSRCSWLETARWRLDGRPDAGALRSVTAVVSVPARDGYGGRVSTDVPADRDPGPSQVNGELLGVYRSRLEADRVADALAAAGWRADSIDVDGDGDAGVSLGAEMREELTRALIAPQASLIMTREGTRSFAFLLMLLTVGGLVVGTAFSFIEWGGFGFWIRWLIVTGAILAMTSVIALTTAPALASRRPQAAMAAEQGVTVRVHADTPQIRSIMLRHEPIRLDEVTPGGHPIDRVANEEDLHDGDSLVAPVERAASDMRENLKTDDFKPPPSEPEERVE